MSRKQKVLLDVEKADLAIAEQVAARDRVSRAAVLRRWLRSGLETDLSNQFNPQEPNV